MKKILLFSRDPGGANTIIPLVKSLKDRGYQVLVYGKDIALEKYRQNKIDAIDLEKIVKSTTVENIRKFLQKENPDFIITGTSSDDMTEKYLWEASKSLGIRSFAILDLWVNYGIRFSKFGMANLDLYLNNKKHEFLPTKILVMDELAKKEAIKDGLPEYRILITGQPHFEALKKRVPDQEVLKNIRKRFSINKSDLVVVFASEPILKTNKESFNRKKSGYDEISIFESLYHSLFKIKCERNIILIVKLHPKEDESYYPDVLKKLPNSKHISVIIDKESNPWDLISIADIVCGMASMFLLESVIIGKPTLSILIGLNGENPFVLDRIGTMKSILRESDLVNKLDDTVHQKNKNEVKLKLIENPVERVINYMEKILCQN